MEVTTWTQLGIHTKPVIVANVHGYYEPLRLLIRQAVESGFISAKNKNLILFVDGPEDRLLYDSFQWGTSVMTVLETCDPYSGSKFWIKLGRKTRLRLQLKVAHSFWLCG